MLFSFRKLPLPASFGEAWDLCSQEFPCLGSSEILLPDIFENLSFSGSAGLCRQGEAFLRAFGLKPSPVGRTPVCSDQPGTFRRLGSRGCRPGCALFLVA